MQKIYVVSSINFQIVKEHRNVFKFFVWQTTLAEDETDSRTNFSMLLLETLLEDKNGNRIIK